MRRKNNTDETFNDVASDLPFILFVVTLLMLAVAMIWMNPVALPVDPQENSLRVEVEWDYGLTERAPASASDQRRLNALEAEGVTLRPGHSAADVDLWVCQIEPKRECIGYNTPNRQTPIFKLDTDDLGWNGRDPKDDVNVEVITGRRSELPAGAYVVNVHLFSPRGEQMPVVAYVKVFINEGRPNQVTLEKRIEFTHRGQEQNAFMFEVDARGSVIPGSVAEGVDSMCIATCRY